MSDWFDGDRAVFKRKNSGKEVGGGRKNLREKPLSWLHGPKIKDVDALARKVATVIRTLDADVISVEGMRGWLVSLPLTLCPSRGPLHS